MRTYPSSKDDRKEVEKLNAAPWMVQCLKANPGYVFWGPHEDYMWKDNEKHGWEGRMMLPDWAALNEAVKLDDVVRVQDDYNRSV